jgi:hypothetical protein
MYDLKARSVEDRPFESCVLVAAHDECIDAVLAHLGPNVGVAALNFGGAWHK